MQGIFRKLGALLLLIPAVAGAATVLDFSTGFAGSGTSLNYNNGAQISGTRARLTDGGLVEARSVWSKNQVDIRKFSCQFSFQIAHGSGDEAGFTFTIQRSGNTVAGYPYEALGYAPITPSVAVKFDIWPSVSTTGIYLNGADPSDNPPASIDMAPSGINLHNGHIFNVSFTYDGATLHQTVTDATDVTHPTFTHDYAIDLVATLSGIDAYVGFTGSTGGTGAIHEIISWTYTVTPSSYDVNFTAFPELLQVYPRNRVTNMAVVPIAGSEEMGGCSQVVLRVYRNGVQVGGDQIQALNYSGGRALFSFTPQIPAEFAHYDFELLIRDSSNQLLSVLRTQDVVAGDVLVIQGQSNALAKRITTSSQNPTPTPAPGTNDGVSDSYASPFIRTLGIESDWAPASTAPAAWMVATGDGVFGIDSRGAIGQWGLVMANQIMTSNNVPLAVLNGALGGQLISFFQRNDAMHDDIATNYGRLLRRLQRAGVAGAVRTILFYQGESDNNDAATHQAGFTALRSDWLEDYPSLERLYVFQVRETDPQGVCGTNVARFNVDLRNRQRLFADQFTGLSMMSTTGLDGHEGCHFYFHNGYESLGFNIARMLQRDLYGGPSLPNTDPPNPAYAVLTGINKNLIRIPLRNRTDTVTFDSGAKADFQVTGTSVTVSSGTVTNGILELTLSGNATGATGIVYTGHTGDSGINITGNWVKNANGVGLLSFIEPLLTDTTPPVITLVGSNPITVGQGTTYVDPGATASDNVDGNITSSIVINTSAVNTAVPGNYTVTFNVTDVAGNAATQVTRTVHVSGGPTANSQSVTTNEDTAKAITLTGTDPDNDPLTFIIVTNPSHGALSGTAPNLTYTPAANYNGTDSFTFKVNDGSGDSNTATVSITVNPVNDPPVADGQSVTTNEDTPKGITLSGSDVDGGALTFTVVSGPAHGTLSGAPPSVTYTPAANYHGSDSFTFKANDGSADSNIATVSITVDTVNDAPIADAQSLTTNEDTAKPITLTASDADGDPLAFSVVVSPAHGTLSGVAPNLTYTPVSNYNGQDSFTFKANDGTTDSNIATISITVNAVNDAPTADAQSITTNEDTAKNVTLTATDVDGDTLTFSVVANPEHGSLSGTAPNLTYTPMTDYNGSDSFTFKANDGTVDSAIATVSITVNAVNDPPTADAQAVTTDEDTAKAIVLIGSDVEGDPLSFSVVTNPQHGVLSGTPPNVTYTPGPNYNGADTFTFKANDGTVDSNAATVSITVTAINDAPIADAQSVTVPANTATPIALTASDVDGDTLSFSVVAAPAHGQLSGTAPNLAYTPAQDFNGHDSFTFKANDGTADSNIATVSITVGTGNGSPTADAQSATTDEDTTKAIVLSASDPEGDTITFSVVGSPTHGQLGGTPPNLTYTPATNYNGSDSFTFKANDGHSDSNVATVSITVSPVNDPPTADAQSVSTNQGTPLNITLTGTDVETAPAALSFTVTVAPAHGSLSGTAPNLTYTPAADYSGPDSFNFTVTDTGDGASPPLSSSEATVSINVTGLPIIEVEQPAGSRLVDGASTVDFGSVAHDANNSHTFLITNIGGANLTNFAVIFDGTNAGDFSVTAPPADPLTPGASTSLTVKFAPTDVGGCSANMHIASNDPSQSPFDIALTGTAITDLEAFRLQYFGSTANSGNGADANDFDLDGISNIVEFATGTNPTQGNAAPVVLTLAGDTLEFVYSQAKAAINDGLTFSVEWTDDLSAPNWNSAGVSEVVLGEDDTLRQIKAAVPGGNNGRRFVRLKVVGVTGTITTPETPSQEIKRQLLPLPRASK